MKRKSLPILGILGFLLFFPFKSLKAETIDVTSGSGNSASVTADDGQCTLTEAILSAHYNSSSFMGIKMNCTVGSGDDIVNLPEGTYVLSKKFSDYNGSGLPGIAGSERLTLKGAGAKKTIIQRDSSASDKFRILYVADSGHLTLNDLTLTGGLVENQPGGGIINYGYLTMQRVRISSNTSTQQGGGIYNLGYLSIAHSTLDGNTGGVSGGGAIYSEKGIVHLISSTVSGNSTLGPGHGAGLFLKGPALVHQSTLFGNKSQNGGGIYLGTSGTASLTNTLLAQNSPNNCAGVVQSFGYNLEDQNSCGLDPQKSDQPNVDPQLSELDDFGGETPVHALQEGSPAIDHADSTKCNVGNGAAKDQRGLARPQGLDCDIGAYERGSCGDGFLEPEEQCEGGADCGADCKKVPPATGDPTGNPNPPPSTGGGCSLVDSSQVPVLNGLASTLVVLSLVFVGLRVKRIRVKK